MSRRGEQLKITVVVEALKLIVLTNTPNEIAVFKYVPLYAFIVFPKKVSFLS